MINILNNDRMIIEVWKRELNLREKKLNMMEKSIILVEEIHMLLIERFVCFLGH